MFKKDFLQYMHADWKLNVKELNEELKQPGRNRLLNLERLRKASEWTAHYAEQLRNLYGVEA